MAISYMLPFKKGIPFGFGITFLIVLTTLGISFWSLHHTVGIFDSVIHREKTSESFLRAFVELKEAEDQLHQFLVTEDPQFLHAYHRLVKTVRADVLTLENLVMTQKQRDQVFPTIHRLILLRLDLLQHILEVRETRGNQEAIGEMLLKEGVHLAQIRQMILNSLQDDVSEFTQLHERAHQMETFAVITMTLGILLTLAVFLFTLWKLQRDYYEREKLERRLLEESKLAEVSRRIADIGHDVKNMLTPIHIGMNLLEEELDEHFQRLPMGGGDEFPKTRELYKDIIAMTRRGSGRIQERVKEIADAVKGVSSPPRFAACQLGKIVDNVLDALRVYAEERGILLHARGLGTLPIVQADEQRLFNAFYNLINNAIPEVPFGGSITVTGALSSDGKEIVLSFEDTGRGMSAEVLHSLFTYQVVSKKPGGTGLGTKIVKDVVDNHGGTVSVKSTEGQGTTFTIRLPLESPVAVGS